MLRSIPLLSPSSIYRSSSSITTRLIGCTCSHYSTSSSRHQHPPSPILSHTTNDDTQLKQVFDSPSFLSQSPSSQRTGIFHQPSLTSPSSLPALALRTTLRAQLIVNRICTPSTPPSTVQEAEVAFLAMVKNLDRLSDLLCGVIDLSELVRNVHPVQEWGEKANEAYEMLCEFMNGLNTNVGLYEVRSLFFFTLLTARISSECRLTLFLLSFLLGPQFELPTPGPQISPRSPSTFNPFKIPTTLRSLRRCDPFPTRFREIRHPPPLARTSEIR